MIPPMLRRPSSLVLSLVVLSVGGCGGGSGPGEPSAPSVDTTRPPQSAPALSVEQVVPDLGGSAVGLTWTSVPNATRYTVEIGRGPGGSDLVTISVDGTTYLWQPAPVGSFFARVRPLNASGAGSASAELGIDSPDPRALIEALFLGQGALSVPSRYPGIVSGCSRDGVYTAWGPGSSIRVVLAAGLTANQRRSAEETARQIDSATMGRITVSVTTTTETNPVPELGEITVANLSATEVAAVCGRPLTGCASPTLRGAIIDRVRVVASPVQGVPTDNTMTHELGHAALGLCHMVSSPPEFGVEPAMKAGGMQTGRIIHGLTAAELSAIRAVYTAGLGPGAARDDFVRAGLIAR